MRWRLRLARGGLVVNFVSFLNYDTLLVFNQLLFTNKRWCDHLHILSPKNNFALVCHHFLHWHWLLKRNISLHYTNIFKLMFFIMATSGDIPALRILPPKPLIICRENGFLLQTRSFSQIKQELCSLLSGMPRAGSIRFGSLSKIRSALKIPALGILILAYQYRTFWVQ